MFQSRSQYSKSDSHNRTFSSVIHAPSGRSVAMCALIKRLSRSQPWTVFFSMPPLGLLLAVASSSAFLWEICPLLTDQKDLSTLESPQERSVCHCFCWLEAMIVGDPGVSAWNLGVMVLGKVGQGR